MVKRIIEITSRNILLVEGKDECNFFKAYLEYLNIVDTIQIIDIGGKDKFRLAYISLSNSPGFSQVERLGFIRDAEDDAVSAFQSIKDIIIEANTKNSFNILVPKKPHEIEQNKTNSVGIFIMPDNTNPGMLEDLCLKSIESTSEYKCVGCFIKCFYDDFTENDKLEFKKSKASVLAFLATRAIGQDHPNALGIAALKKIWNFDNQCFNNLREFISQLFMRMLFL